MEEKIKLKLTKKKPDFVWGINDRGEVICGKEYLYTNTGKTKRWWIAIKILYKNQQNNQPKQEIEFILKDENENR